MTDCILFATNKKGNVFRQIFVTGMKLTDNRIQELTSFYEKRYKGLEVMCILELSSRQHTEQELRNFSITDPPKGEIIICHVLDD
jgi:SOS response regulatory protein OraA/RecX